MQIHLHIVKKINLGFFFENQQHNFNWQVIPDSRQTQIRENEFLYKKENTTKKLIEMLIAYCGNCICNENAKI